MDVHGEFNPKDWRKIQLDDPHIFPIHRCVTNGEKLRKNKYAHKETLQLYRSVDNFELQRGVLYRSTIEEIATSSSKIIQSSSNQRFA